MSLLGTPEEPLIPRLWVIKKLVAPYLRRIILGSLVLVISMPPQLVLAKNYEPPPVYRPNNPPLAEGFFSKPILVATEMGIPEKELIAKQEEEKRIQNQKTYTKAVGGNGYSVGYCTAYVAVRRPSIPQNLGNANTWLSRAKAQGLATGGEPQVGSIVQTSESWYGHVALVEAIEGDQLIISEQNYQGWGIVSSRRLSVNSGVIRGYIY